VASLHRSAGVNGDAKRNKEKEKQAGQREKPWAKNSSNRGHGTINSWGNTANRSLFVETGSGKEIWSSLLTRPPPP